MMTHDDYRIGKVVELMRQVREPQRHNEVGIARAIIDALEEQSPLVVSMGQVDKMRQDMCNVPTRGTMVSALTAAGFQVESEGE